MSAVTVTYHTGPALWRCLDSVLAQPELGELLVVINGADEETRALLRSRARRDRRIRLIDPRRNLGFARGCNIGAAAATFDHIALINPDCAFAADAFGKVLKVLTHRPNVWLVGGRLQHPDGSEQKGGRREFLTPWRALVEVTRCDRFFPRHPYFRRLNIFEKKTGDTIVPVVSGAFMMMQRRRYLEIGGMDENFFLHCDDLDLCLRIHRAGGEVWHAGDVPITHYRSTSDAPRLFIEWHKTRSSCYYFKKHFASTYPRWALSVVCAVLWVRFMVMAAVSAPHGLQRTSATNAGLAGARAFGLVEQNGARRV